MISICIPVYNFDISGLISELESQIHSLHTESEIIVIDDGSHTFKEINRKTCRNATYIELPQNVGRAKIRNRFPDYARFNYLLFLDCDSLLKNESFIKNYLDAIQSNPDVVCGGRVYETEKPGRDRRLRWKYGIQKESQPDEVRRRFPYRSFMTNNFLIRKETLTENRFDERITRYGHEDTLFGYKLKKKKISITHIDNPVVNGDIETNSEFLIKTRHGVENLAKILTFKEYSEDLRTEIALLRAHSRVKKFEVPIAVIFKISRPLLVFFLKRGYVSLVVFDFYKLGILIESLRKST